MDPKELKSCLKSAREAIRSKEFKEAAKQCKAVLAADSNNYNALVFLGVAAEGLEQADQALKAYKRATEQHPDQLLAWQGISSMLEKSPTLMTSAESIDVFQKLVSLHESDKAKQTLQRHKLLDLYTKTEQHEKALQVVDEILDFETEWERRMKPLCCMISLLSKTSPKLSESDLAKYQSALMEVTFLKEDFPDRDHYSYLLLKLLSQIKLHGVLPTCKSLGFYTTLSSPLEFHLRYILDEHIGCGRPTQAICDSVSTLTERLAALQTDNPIIKIGQAFVEIYKRNFVGAMDLLSDVADDSISGQYLLSQLYLHFHSSTSCMEACNKGLKACKGEKRVLCAAPAHVMSLFKLAKSEAYLRVGTEEAQAKTLEILEEVVETMPTEAFLIKAYVFLQQGDIDKAQECTNYLPPAPLAVQTLKASILYEKKAYESALKIVQSVCKEDPNDEHATLLLGRTLWELRNSQTIDNVKQECFTALLKAAKLDPYNDKCFFYIGLFYKQIQGDAHKARRCFQKAFDLCPGNDGNGSALVDVLIELGEEDQSLKILQKVTTSAPAGSCKWAWLRLGLHQIRHEDPSTAIMSLQSALRADPEDQHVWECLAEAYLQRGSFTAALKAFTKASELDPESVYCLHQIASIKHTLGMAAEAIAEFEIVLEKLPTYVPALKGISESLIQLGKHNMSQCLDGLAQSNFERAIVKLTRAASLRPDLSCVWKLLGDACTTASRLAAHTYRVPAKLVAKQVQDQNKDTITKVNVLELLQIGSRSYSQTLKILPESDSLWHDVAVNLYYQSQRCGSGDNLGLLNKAIQVMKKAISLQPKEGKHWNALGVMACSKDSHKPALAQHCFIKSIECESSNAAAWTNLGALYLDKGEIKLAHEAFTAAQSIDPTYMACWIGQALIAEIVGHEEAMDLFRHTTELGFHPEGAVSYGQWVLSVLSDSSKRDSSLYQYCIQQMAAVPAATDAIERYTTRVKNDPTAINMKGLLLEHQNLLASSADAFSLATSILEGKTDKCSEYNKIKLNLARVLCKQKKFEESVKNYEQCNMGDSVEHLCMYGLALLHCGRLEDSLKVYHTALGLSQETSPGVQSQIHTALGMVAFMQGDAIGAKSFLFDAFQSSQPSLCGLLALCALGCIQGDSTLASAVLEELAKREDANLCRADVMFLEFFKHMTEGDREEGERRLKEATNVHSTDASLWALHAGLTLRTCETDGLEAEKQARTALELETDCHKKMQQKRLLTMGQLSGGLHSRFCSDKNALKIAQKAFHANPGCPSTLATMACAVHAEAEIKRALGSTCTHLLRVGHALLNLILADGNASKELVIWCHQLLPLNCFLQGDTTNAQKHLEILQKKVEKTSNMGIFVGMIVGLISGQPCPTELEHSHRLAFLVNCSFLNTQKRVSLLQSALDNRSGSMQPLLERIAYESYKAVVASNDSALETIYEGTIKSLKDQDLKSSVGSLLQALKTSRETPDNKRLVKHFFATALDQIDTARELGYGSSLLRQQLVALLWDSKKESDRGMVQGLLEDAASKGDSATDKCYKKLVSRQE